MQENAKAAPPSRKSTKAKLNDFIERANELGK